MPRHPGLWNGTGRAVRLAPSSFGSRRSVALADYLFFAIIRRSRARMISRS